MKAFKRWLKLALERLDRAKANFDAYDLECVLHDHVMAEAGYLAGELGKLAAELGLHGIVAEAAELEGYAEPDAVRVLLTKAITACEPPKTVLTVAEAAAELRIGEEAVRAKCRKHEIEHWQEGTRGRGGNGKYLIPRHAIDAYKARQAVRQTTPPSQVPHARKRPPVVNPFW